VVGVRLGQQNLSGEGEDGQPVGSLTSPLPSSRVRGNKSNPACAHHTAFTRALTDATLSFPCTGKAGGRGQKRGVGERQEDPMQSEYGYSSRPGGWRQGRHDGAPTFISYSSTTGGWEAA